MIVNETLAVIKRRRSIRSYQDKQITEEELQAILEAGMFAPHAGDQAWHFTVIQNRELLERLNLAAKEAARQMPMKHLQDLGADENFNCLYGAPTLIIVSGDTNTPIPLDADCAAATQNMLLAAESLGLGSCWIFFVLLAFNSAQGSEFQKILIPEGYKPYYAALFGCREDEIPPAPVRKPDLITYIK